MVESEEILRLTRHDGLDGHRSSSAHLLSPCITTTNEEGCPKLRYCPFSFSFFFSFWILLHMKPNGGWSYNLMRSLSLYQEICGSMDQALIRFNKRN